MAKRYDVTYAELTLCVGWYVEEQEGDEGASWAIIAGPFDTEDKAWDALDKLRED